MSGACVGPGRRSLQGLGWLARVGASPLEPLALVLGCSQRRAHDHVRRLSSAGLVTRVAMRRGDGSLIVLTGRGAVEAGYPAGRAPRSLAPTTWAHTSACAWVSAWLALRLQTRWAADPQMAWWSEREVAQDDFWRRDVRYQDRRGSVRVTHRPDLGVRIAGRPVPVEVELQRKVRARLLGILSMYAQLSTGVDAAYGGVIYIAGSEDVAAAVRRVAADAGLRAPVLSVRALPQVVEQTRSAALELAGRRAPACVGGGQ
jgi:hypothetical protein